MDPTNVYTCNENVELSSVAFCAHSSSFVTAGTNGTIYFHESPARTIKYKCNAKVRCVALAPKDERMFCAGEDGNIYIFEISVLKARNTEKPQPGIINYISFSPDGTRYTIASNDKSAKIYKYPTHEFIASLVGHSRFVNTSEFSPDSNVIVTASDDKTVRIWDVLNKDKPRIFKFPAPATCASFHPSGTIIGVGLENGSFFIIDVRNEKTIQYYPDAHNGKITALRFHPSGSFALTSSTDKKLGIWDLVEGLKFYTIEAFSNEIVDCKWNANGSQFIACDKRGEIRVFNTNFDKLIENTTVNSASTGDKRIDEATGVMNPDLKKGRQSKKESAAQKYDAMSPEEKNAKIEAALNAMLTQVEYLTQSAAMMTERMNMQSKTIERLQNEGEK